MRWYYGSGTTGTLFSVRSPYNMYILDLEFPQADGFSVLRMLRDKAPDSRILIYTMHEEPWMLAKLIDADIDGLVSKNADLSELQKADFYFAEWRNLFQRGVSRYDPAWKRVLYLYGE